MDKEITFLEHTSEKLVKLTTIFENGYTVELKNWQINQYCNMSKPYIVSYKTLIAINTLNDNKTFCYTSIPKNCLIGYWVDSDKIGWIEVNKAFKYKWQALKFAKRHRQKYIYNYKNGGVIGVNC